MANAMSSDRNYGHLDSLISYNQGVLIQGNNISTGRDVNINVTASLARSLYKSITSFDSFQLLANDISSIVMALSDIKGILPGIRADQDSKKEYVAIMTSCEAVLVSTESLLLEYTGLSVTERETWERSGRTSDQVATLKEVLAQIVRRLTLFNTTQDRVTMNKINDALQQLIEQIRLIGAQSQHHNIPHTQDQQGLDGDAHLAISEVAPSYSNEETVCDQTDNLDAREGSILSMYTAESMTFDEKENWRQLRKALQGVGITNQLFDQRQGYITSKIRELIDGGALEEEGEEVDRKISKSQPGQNSTAQRTISTQDSDTLKSSSSIYTFYSCKDGNEQSGPEVPLSSTTKSESSQLSRTDKILKSLGYFRQDTRLLSAIERGDVTSVNKCLRRGANIDGGSKTRPDSQVPLLLAVNCGYGAIVRMLLDHGADAEVRDIMGQNSLMFAAEFRLSDLVQLLLDRGADIEARDYSGMTPLILGASQSFLVGATGQKEVVQLLLDRGADIEARDILGRTPLIEAALWSHKDMVQLLLAYGANLEAEDKNGKKAIDYARKGDAKDREAMVQVLLAHRESRLRQDEHANH